MISIKSVESNVSESIDCNSSPKNVEHRLKAAIFCNGYDKSQRPVKDHRTVTNMAIKMLIKSYDYVVIVMLLDLLDFKEISSFRLIVVRHYRLILGWLL